MHNWQVILMNTQTKDIVTSFIVKAKDVHADTDGHVFLEPPNKLGRVMMPITLSFEGPVKFHIMEIK